MKIIALTGKTGAGKSAVSRLLARAGVAAIDCDVISRDLMRENSPLLPLIEAAFPNSTRAGALDRAALAAAAFASPENTAKLNAITHPFILSEVSAQLEAARRSGAKAAVVDGAALIESGFVEKCDLVVTLTAPENVRLCRLLARDEVGEAALLARIRAQREDTFYTEAADVVIENDGDETKLKAAVDALLERILK